MRGLLLSLLAFLSVLPPAAGQRPDGDTNGLFMEAIVDEKPVVLSAPQLHYPKALKEAGLEGRVIVQAIIDTMGRAEPRTVKVLQSPNPGFDQDAIGYVLEALFRPARVHGRAVRVLVQVPVAFRLKGR
jgi:protein TonB